MIISSRYMCVIANRIHIRDNITATNEIGVFLK